MAVPGRKDLDEAPTKQSGVHHEEDQDQHEDHTHDQNQLVDHLTVFTAIRHLGSPQNTEKQETQSQINRQEKSNPPHPVPGPPQPHICPPCHLHFRSPIGAWPRAEKETKQALYIGPLVTAYFLDPVQLEPLNQVGAIAAQFENDLQDEVKPTGGPRTVAPVPWARC